MKEQILKLKSEGVSYRKIAKMLGIKKSTVDYYCNTEKCKLRQSKVRRNNRKRLLDSAGGKCCLCGYDKSISALDFHHKDPNQKSFGIAEGSRLKFSFEKLLEETKKCVLICSNCHHEVHDGLIDLKTAL